MNKKLLIGIGAGVLIYWIYTRNKAGKSLNPFAKTSSFDGDMDFYNAVDPREVRFKTTSAGCQIYQGSTSAPVGTILDGNRVIVSNGPSTTVVCPRSNTSTGLPVKA